MSGTALPGPADLLQTAARLRESILTATNDDLSDPQTEDRRRHTARINAMEDAAGLLELLHRLAAAPAAPHPPSDIEKIIATLRHPGAAVREVLGKRGLDFLEETAATLERLSRGVPGQNGTMRELRRALARMCRAYPPPYGGKPVGEPGSAARIEQVERIAAHKEALALSAGEAPDGWIEAIARKLAAMDGNRFAGDPRPGTRIAPHDEEKYRARAREIAAL